MKIGVCLEMFFTDRPFTDRIAAAAEAGCRNVEMWFIDATAGVENGAKDPDAIRTVAQQAGVTVTNAVIGSPDGSLGGGLTDPARRGEWLDRTDATLDFCRKAGIGAAIVCTGNGVEGSTRGQMRSSVLDGLRSTVDKADAYGVDLWLEPLNDKIDHKGYMLTGSDAAADLCREIGSPRLKLLFDCYHMQIMEGDLIGHLERHKDVLGHVHMAGHPGRHELWLGEINYPFVVRRIETMGYEGVIALEYAPTLDPSESLRRAIAYLEGEIT